MLLTYLWKSSLGRAISNVHISILGYAAAPARAGSRAIAVRHNFMIVSRTLLAQMTPNIHLNIPHKHTDTIQARMSGWLSIAGEGMNRSAQHVVREEGRVSLLTWQGSGRWGIYHRPTGVRSAVHRWTRTRTGVSTDSWASHCPYIHGYWCFLILVTAMMRNIPLLKLQPINA